MSPTQEDHPDLTLSDDAEGQPSEVVKCLNLTIREAVEQRASDIHLDPTEDGRGRVRLRVDGVLRDFEPPPAGLFASLVSRIKTFSHMDLTERRLTQDGRIKLNVAHRALDLRVSLVPTVFGERIVMRILERSQIAFDLERLGLFDDALAALRGLCALPTGLVIVNGPTGSGKTTLLYSMLYALDRKRRCVMSIEDPVEYHLDDVSQIQVDAKRGLTFGRALRHVMRQDPDVIMIGELRDLPTLQGAVTAAVTGHLALTTLHANTSPGAVKRMLDMGLEPYLLNNAVAGVVSLRLVRVLCPKCRQEADPALHSVPPEAAELIERLPDAAFCGPKGCEHCAGTGYRGRTGIYEILIPNDRVHQAVLAAAGLDAIRNAALATGMTPMLLNGLRTAARGITSVQEVCRVAPHGPNV